MADEAKAVVIDDATGMMRGGIAGEDAPKSVFPTIVGRPNFVIGTEDKEIYLGYEAKEKWQILKTENPIDEGNVINWDDMIKVWNYLYYSELRVDPTEQPVHIAETSKPAKGSREKTMEIMFEDFSVPAFYVSMQSVLSLFASGKTIGLVLDSGEGVTSMVPIYEAYSMNHAITNMKVAGKDLTAYILKLIQDSGAKIGPNLQPLEVAKEIKERTCFVATDFEDECKAYDSGEGRVTDYTMPDGKTVRISSQSIKCPEVLFTPSLLKKDFGGIQQFCYNSIQKCDQDLRRELYGNILLAGGSTMFPGFADRLKKEVSALAPSSATVKVTAPDERKYSAWIGGSILSTLATFQTMWVLRQEYDEAGPSVVQRKCV